MIKDRARKCLYGLSALLLMTGCSIKENRDVCPCHLVLDFKRVDTLSIRTVSVYAAEFLNEGMYSGNETVQERDLSLQEFFPEYHLDVPRSDLRVNVCSGDAGTFHSGEGVVIPYGEECPRIYMYSGAIDARTEFHRETVELAKNHCVMTLVIENPEVFSYGLCIRGNVCGYDMEGCPAEGGFMYVPVPFSEGEYRVVIPRQTDSSLMMEVTDGTEIVRSFALGEFIAAGGYDWNSFDLEDITVRINWALSAVTFAVQGWDWIYEYEIVI